MNPYESRLPTKVVRHTNRFLALLSVLAWVTMIPAIAWSQPAKESDAAATKNAKPNAAEGQKWALLIGVDHYLDPRLGNLRFCGADVRALRDVLVRQGGFPADQVIVLHDQEKEPVRQPLRLSIERSLKALLAQAGPQDLVLVSFSGHGIQVGETAYLCPIEADLDKPEATMVSVAALYETLSKQCRAAQKIVFVDACRKPVESGQKAPALELAKGFSERLRQVPEGLLILSSCKSGQLSYEEKDFGHGVFAHFLLDGLTGKADARGPNLRGNGDGRIDVDELFNYASTQTGKYVMNKFVEAQTPELYGVRRGPIDLLAALPDVKEVLDKALKVAASIGAQERRFGSSWNSEAGYDLKSAALALVARAQAKAGNQQRARLIFADALRSARAISDDSEKWRTLCLIAGSQAQAGELPAAMATAASVSDESIKTLTYFFPWDDEEESPLLLKAFDFEGELPRDKVSLLLSIAFIQAKTGNKQRALESLKDALQVARLVTDRSAKARALRVIAIVQAHVGDNESARETLREAVRTGRLIENEFQQDARSTCLSQIARAQSRVGDMDAARSTAREALQTVQSIKDSPYKVSALGEVALAQVRAGDKEAAKVTIENALREFRAIPTDATFRPSLKQIVTAQVEVSGVEQALQTARSINREEDENAATNAILEYQLKAGKLDEALETARVFKRRWGRALVDQVTVSAVYIAMRQADAGDVIAARSAIQESIESLEELLPKEGNKSGSLGPFAFIAIAQAKAGLTFEATATVRDELLPRWGNEGFLLGMEQFVMAYCRGQVKHGGAVQTYELANDIPIASDQVVLLVCLAEAILEQQKPAVSKISSDSNQPAK